MGHWGCPLAVPPYTAVAVGRVDIWAHWNITQFTDLCDVFKSITA